MAPFQLRVRTLYPRTQPVPFTPLSVHDERGGVSLEASDQVAVLLPLSPRIRRPPKKFGGLLSGTDTQP